jgi:hypothetical protein
VHVRRILVVACSLLLASCANPRQPQTLAPGQVFKGGYINVSAPNAEGWRLAESTNDGMAFAKAARGPGDTLGAQLLTFELQAAETPEQFVALIREGIQRETDPKRFDVLESRSEYTSERGYPCVRHQSVVADKEALTSPGTREQLLLETRALYCRHPLRTNTGFAAIYSHRGRGAYPGLADEAREFIRGVQVP